MNYCLKRTLVAGLSVLGIAPGAWAQIVVEPVGSETTALEMAQSLAGSSVTVQNASFVGNALSGGLFSGGQPIGIGTGVILSTGSAANARGPNNTPSSSGTSGTPGDADLDRLVNGQTQDAAALIFDVVPSSNRITFEYVFGSEEYTEFEGGEFNDVFAFFVNDQNCALLPGSSVPVSVNTVNSTSNSSLFINNVNGQADTQLDGFTRLLRCEASVTPNAPNRVKLVIADRADNLLDSVVFIAGNTLVSGRPPVAQLSAEVPSPATAPVQVTFSTAGTSDPDGPLQSGTISFGDGSTVFFQGNPLAQFTHTYQSAGTFNAQLSVTDSEGNQATDAVQVVVQAAQGPAVVGFTQSAFPGSEASGTATLTLSRSGSTAAAVTVTVSTASGTAISGQDFQAANTPVTWAANDGANKTVNLSIINDSDVDGGESFSVSIAIQSGAATLGPTSSATVTITDNDSTTSSTVQTSDGQSASVSTDAGMLTRIAVLDEPSAPLANDLEPEIVLSLELTLGGAQGQALAKAGTAVFKILAAADTQDGGIFVCSPKFGCIRIPAESISDDPAVPGQKNIQIEDGSSLDLDETVNSKVLTEMVLASPKISGGGGGGGGGGGMSLLLLSLLGAAARMRPCPSSGRRG